MGGRCWPWSSLSLFAQLWSIEPCSLTLICVRPSRDAFSGINCIVDWPQTLATGDTPKVSIVKGYPTLSIFGAGDESGFNPTELLAKKRFHRLIDSTRKLFDFIVVDYAALQRLLRLSGDFCCGRSCHHATSRPRSTPTKIPARC